MIQTCVILSSLDQSNQPLYPVSSFLTISEGRCPLIKVDTDKLDTDMNKLHPLRYAGRSSPASREGAGLEHDMAKMTLRRSGGLLHFLKNGANEIKFDKISIFYRRFEDISVNKIQKIFTVVAKMTKKSQMNCLKFLT